MQPRRLPALALAAALVLVSCDGDSDTNGDADPVTEDVTENPSEPEQDDDGPVDDPEPVEEDPEPEPDDEPEPEEPEDPFAVPDEIDEDYVQTVMDELMRRDSDRVRGLLYREPGSSIEQEDLDLINALFSGSLQQERTDSTLAMLQSDEARAGQLPPNEFGEFAFEVMELYSVENECLTVLGWWDLTETAVEPFPDDLHMAFVVQHDAEISEELNPTGWLLRDNNALVSDGVPVDRAEWQAIELEHVLDVDCGLNGQ